MGRERAPFDDQKWNERLMKKVMEDLERRLDENERKLEEAENRRVLKLKLMGIINGQDWEEEERMRHAQKPHKKTAAERKFEKRNQLARESVFRPSEDIETQMEILHRDESQVKRRSTGHNSSSSNNNNSFDQTSEDVEVTDSAADESERDQQEAQEEAESNGAARKEHNHQLRKLFEEEDLRELYREAESLVRLSQAGNTKTAKKK